MTTVTADFYFKLKFVYITTAIRAVDFNGVAWLKLAVV
jgi:hypothetical protein